MFCGWRLVNSYGTLEQLGSGELRIDALTEACSFDGAPVQSLSIATELAAWLREDLAANRIEAAAVREALLVADLEFGEIDRSGRTTRSEHFAPDGRHVSPARFIRLDIRCSSRVATDERIYTSEYRDREEWPAGWPGRG